MITTQDEDYKLTKRLKQSGTNPAPPFLEIAEWVARTYDVSVLNALYDTIQPDNRPRLNVVMEFESDRAKFREGDFGNFDRVKQKAVAEQFQAILHQQGNQRFNTKWLFVIFSFFEHVARADANGRVTKLQIEQLKQSLANPDLWEISVCFDVVTFFFYTDAQVASAKASGLLERYAKAYALVVEPYDEFGYLQRVGIHVHFDSKENFDTNFKSNWYYYYK